jgi:hypothetical protein
LCDASRTIALLVARDEARRAAELVEEKTEKHAELRSVVHGIRPKAIENKRLNALHGPEIIEKSGKLGVGEQLLRMEWSQFLRGS